jgi:hypothetical protein
LLSCGENLDFIWREDLSNGIKLEYYIDGGGVYAGNTNYYFLIDSLGSRKLIAEFNDNQSVFVDLSECGIQVMKYKNKGSLKKGQLLDSACLPYHYGIQ